MDHLHSIENEFVKVVVNDQGAELWELWNKETKEQVTGERRSCFPLSAGFPAMRFTIRANPGRWDSMDLQGIWPLK